MIREKSESDAFLRLPARDIEDLVVSKLKSLLGSPQRLLEAISSSAEKEKEFIVAESQAWSLATEEDLRRALVAVLTRIVLKEKALEMRLSEFPSREIALVGRKRCQMGEGPRIVTDYR